MGYSLETAFRALPRQRRLPLSRGWLLPGVALVVTALVYAPTLDNYFFGDDFPDLADVATKGTAQYLRDAFVVRSSSFYWRLLTRVLYLVEYRLFGLNPVPYHAVNLALHLGVVLLVYWWAREFTGRRAVAFLAALLFGIAPTYTSASGGGGAVAWITAVHRLLGTFFFLLSLFLLQRYLKGGRADLRLAAGSLGSFLLTILTDQSAAVLMPVLALYAWLFHYGPRRDARGFVLLMAPFALSAAVAIAFLYYIQIGRPYLRATDYKLGWHMARNFWIYLGRFAFPVRAGYPVPDSWWLIHRVGGVIIGALGLYFLVRGPKRARFLVLWFPAALLPFLPWAPWTPGRYTYPAAIPFFVGIALLGAWAYERACRFSIRWATFGGAALAAAVVVVASALTVRTNSGFGLRSLSYEVLVEELNEELPSAPSGSQIYILNGIWEHRFDNLIWLPAIGRTLYGPKTFLKNLHRGDCAQRAA